MLSAGPIAVWAGKTTSHVADDQVIFLDNSCIRVDPGQVFGRFIGQGLVGVSTIEIAGLKVQWLRLMHTDFQLGIAGKTTTPAQTKHIKFDTSGGIAANGVREFACGSTVEHTLDVVDFHFVGEGVLLVRYMPQQPKQGLLLAETTLPSVRRRELAGVSAR